MTKYRPSSVVNIKYDEILKEIAEALYTNSDINNLAPLEKTPNKQGIIWEHLNCSGVVK